MHDSGIEALEAEPGLLSGGAIPFRFEVTWHSLTQADEHAAVIAQSTATGDSLAGDLLASVGKEWVTVLPSVRRRATLVLSYVSPAPPLQGSSFATATDRGSQRKSTVLAALAALALVLLILALGAARGEKQSSPDETPASTRFDPSLGWISESVSDAKGLAHERQLSLYRPSLPMSDYRLLFSGRIERKSLGWVFRAADSRNYYVGKLQVSKPGVPVTLIRYGVIRGVEDPHIQIALPHVSGAGVLNVRLDANRSRFTIYVQNQIVADWEDDRLKTGGVGFISERKERGHVESMLISFSKAGISQ